MGIGFAFLLIAVYFVYRFAFKGGADPINRTKRIYYYRKRKRQRRKKLKQKDKE